MIETLLFFLILFPVFAESIPDYDNPYSPIFTNKSVYSWTDKVKMTIIAPSWNTDKHLIDSIGDDQEHPIKISTRGHSLEPYRFTETDVNSGIFTAEIILTGFPHDANGDGDVDTTPRTGGNGPTGGFLETDRDSAITISFEFADGIVLSESVPISWNLATVEFLDEIYFPDDSITIRVVDLDMNLNPEAIDQIPIDVFSDSDAAGIQINGIETSENSGVFVATISLTPSFSSGNRLFSVPGDVITAKYNDHTLPKPYTTSDNLEIQSFTTVGSSTPLIERIQNSPVVLSDDLGNVLYSFSENNQIQLVGSITNNQDYKQKFVYFFQVKTSDNSIESLSWIQGELPAAQSLDVSQSWVPKNSGAYTIETFVWSSLVDPNALGPASSKTIIVK